MKFVFLVTPQSCTIARSVEKCGFMTYKSKIYYIETDQSAGQFARRILNTEGYQVCLIPNGTVGILTMTYSPPDKRHPDQAIHTYRAG